MQRLSAVVSARISTPRVMSQPTITKFFRPLGTTTKRSGEHLNDEDEQQQKKIKADDENLRTLTALKIEKQAKATPALSTSIGISWFNALEDEFNKDYFKRLSRHLVEQRRSYTVYPPENEVFTWTQMTHIRDTRVVILGQDPYHEPNQAHGLAFSVKKGVKPPPSLKNIFIELQNDVEDFCEPKHGDLSGWAKQGVLLLNSSLTVRKGEANSHSTIGWEILTDAVIKWLSTNLSNLVFLLWGSFAHKKGAVIDTKKHFVLKSSHPSPLSYQRGFHGCKHFSKVNAYLKEHGKPEINWSDL